MPPEAPAAPAAVAPAAPEVSAPAVATPPAPQPAAPTAAAPPAPAAPAAKAPTTEVQLTSAQLRERLKEAGSAGERALLKAHGFEKPEDLANALKALKDLQDAGKTEKERLETRIKELEPLATEVPTLRASLATMVSAQFGVLPEAMQTAIDKVANGDPNKRLAQIEIFRAAGVIGGTPAPAGTTVTTTTEIATPATPPAAPAPVAAPATVVPSPAPAPSGAPTAFQKWEQVRAQSPMAGDIFYQNNQREIEKTRPASP